MAKRKPIKIKAWLVVDDNGRYRPVMEPVRDDARAHIRDNLHYRDAKWRAVPVIITELPRKRRGLR